MKMDKKQADDYLRSQIGDYLQRKNINIHKNFRCLNPDHDDKHPSMSYHQATNKVNCFSCHKSYSIFDLIGLDNNMDISESNFSALFKEACKEYDIQIDDTVRKNYKERSTTQPRTAGQAKKKDIDIYIKKCKANIGNTTYFETRGLSLKTIERYNLGYDNDYNEYGQHWKAVIIPTSKNTYIARNIDLDAEKQNRVRKNKGKGTAVIYNTEGLYKDGCFIVEGEIDALSIIEAGGEVSALGGTQFVNKLCDKLKEVQESKTFEKPLILYLDNDEKGQEAQQKLIIKLNELKIPYIQWENYRGCKDANEALVKDRGQFIKDIDQMKAKADNLEKVQYLDTRTDNYIKLFVNGIKENADTKAISTGFKRLDMALGDGLYEGLYIVGAISSLGKTTLMMQIADNMASNDQDVLIFSLEMARTELMSKSISRLTFLEASERFKNEKEKRKELIHSHSKTARGITTGARYKRYSNEELRIINAAINKYKQTYAKNLYINQGMGDIGAKEIEATIEKHIKYTGNKPVVIIDYLQLLAPHDMRGTDKQNTDRAVLAIKRMSRDNKIPIIAISSFNRQSYNQAVTMSAWKESGSIEYSSDVLIGLQAKGVEDKGFDIDDAKKKDPREIELKILKNRNGRTGCKIEYDYYPMFNYFKEEITQAPLY